MAANYKQITHLYGLYLCGCSLANLAKHCGNGLSRQQIFYYFKRLGFKTRPNKKLKSIPYGDDLYTINCKGYYRKTSGDRELLHRQKWKDEHGEIESSHDIHHLDGNKLNNEMTNFEKISKSEHTKRFCVFNNQHTKGKKFREEIIIKKCANCHEDIPDKGYGPAYYKARSFCSLACRHCFDRANGNTIGDKRRMVK